MKQPEVFIVHIWDAIEHIENFIDGISIETFLEDVKTQSAVIKQLEIIGEASTHFETDFKDKLKDVDWKQIKAFRNKLVHDYWEIDLKLVWKIIHQDMPKLKEALRREHEKINLEDIVEEW